VKKSKIFETLRYLRCQKVDRNLTSEFLLHFNSIFQLFYVQTRPIWKVNCHSRVAIFLGIVNRQSIYRHSRHTWILILCMVPVKNSFFIYIYITRRGHIRRLACAISGILNDIFLLPFLKRTLWEGCWAFSSSNVKGISSHRVILFTFYFSNSNVKSFSKCEMFHVIAWNVSRFY
jgi:hypothetical protein